MEQKELPRGKGGVIDSDNNFDDGHQEGKSNQRLLHLEKFLLAPSILSTPIQSTYCDLFPFTTNQSTLQSCVYLAHALNATNYFGFNFTSVDYNIHIFLRQPRNLSGIVTSGPVIMYHHHNNLTMRSPLELKHLRVYFQKPD